VLANLYTFFAAIVISAAAIPLMIRLAPRLGMVDVPDPRKVHTIPIPRVGGVGIVIGALIPVRACTPICSVPWCCWRSASGTTAVSLAIT
jgi:UDP-GlcNAc:undecaprenyl-phosphate/decaprenyl-phosphate GlcNAc-1-phosphate transferase